MWRALVIVFCTLLLVVSSAGQVPPFKDFDVVAAAVDSNSFPLNPKWGKQVTQGVEPDPSKSCPLTSDDEKTAEWTSDPRFPNCTSFPVTFNGGIWCGPHVNFRPVTYEGNVLWDAHASHWLDDDYTFNVLRDDHALYNTAEQEIHIEFNSDETVDNWDDTQTWWDNFHHNAVDKNSFIAHELIDGKFVIVTGLLNLDTLHGGKTELHPVYSMFVQLHGPTPKTISWAFFVRNWGDEGFCGSDQQNLNTPSHQVKVRIPNAESLVEQNVWYGSQSGDDLRSMRATAQKDGNDVILTFTLLSPEQQSWFVGDLTFTPSKPVTLPARVPARAGKPSEAEDKDPDPELSAQVARLPDSARRELTAQLHRAFPRKKPRKTEVKVLAAAAKPEKIAARAPAKVAYEPGLVRPQKDPAAEQRRQKKIALTRKFLSEHQNR